MSKEEKILESLDNYINLVTDLSSYDEEKFLKMFYKKQKEYIINPQKYGITLFYGGARAGKSFANLGKTAHKDMSDTRWGRIVITSATEQKVKQLYWEKLKSAKKALNLPWDFKDKDSQIVTPNSEIVFRGLKDINNANKDQGFTIKMCIIDEPQTIRPDILKHYIENVIRPRCIELNAEICLTGNPPHFPFPYLKDLYNNKEVRTITTNFFDNESLTMKQKVDFLEKERKRLGVIKGEEPPAFRREYFGEMIEDTDLVIFKPTKEKNVFHQLPLYDAQENPIVWEKVMGVDVGSDDSDAVVVVYYSGVLNKVFIVEEFEKSGQNIKQLADKINIYSNNHGGIDIKVIDTGGLGKKVNLDLAERYDVHLIPAEKHEKMTFVEIMKAEIDSGNVLFKEGSALMKEMERIIYTIDREKIDGKKGYHSDLLDAALYAFRYIYSHIMPTSKEADRRTWEEKRLDDLIEMNDRKKKIKYPT